MRCEREEGASLPRSAWTWAFLFLFTRIFIIFTACYVIDELLPKVNKNSGCARAHPAAHPLAPPLITDDDEETPKQLTIASICSSSM